MIGRVLCWLGIHDWRLYELAALGGYWEPDEGVRVQLRCSRCGRIRQSLMERYHPAAYNYRVTRWRQVNSHGDDGLSPRLPLPGAVDDTAQAGEGE